MDMRLQFIDQSILFAKSCSFLIIIRWQIQEYLQSIIWNTRTTCDPSIREESQMWNCMSSYSVNQKHGPSFRKHKEWTKDNATSVPVLSTTFQTWGLSLTFRLHTTVHSTVLAWPSDLPFPYVRRQSYYTQYFFLLLVNLKRPYCYAERYKF